MILLPQAERVMEDVRHNMPSVFPCSQTALTGDDISYLGAPRQAPVRVPVIGRFHLNVQTPLCPGQSSIILIAAHMVEFCSFGYPTSLQQRTMKARRETTNQQW